MAFSVGFCLNFLGKSQSPLVPSVSSNSLSVSSFSANNVVFDCMKKLHNSIALTRASPEGIASWNSGFIAKSLPRICIFCGLSREEMMMFIDAFPETGLEPAVFAALVPNSADKSVAEIMGDHETLTAEQSGST
ncbi:hypothetical protein HRI_002705000 [Hibiscus trionum]|uniref:Uncharacterized protein n=1 Tax=Hibiscus trionum TaxID=183268 RepID=A0A9W7I717_HIBTR|nr:hypothetical protein HRI_002705000 [Hibiscus trionum]